MMSRVRAWMSTPLTALLVGTCVAIWGAALALDGGQPGPATLWALASADDLWSGSSLHALFSSCLVHYEVVHLFFNMYWIVKLGPVLERELGAPKVLALSVPAALVASAAQLGWGSQTGVGFSGVLYAWAGFMWLSSPRHPAFAAVMTKQTWLWFLGWLVLCMVVTTIPGLGSVANAAHVGGLLWGLAAGAAFHARLRPLGWASTAVLLGSAAASLVWAPWNPSWHMRLGFLALDRGDLAAAAAHASAAQRGEELGRASWLLADVAWRKSEFDRAALLFDTALDHLPTFHDGQLEVGRNFLGIGSCQHADRFLKRALAARPDHPETLIRAGRAAECLGQSDIAWQHYTTALALPDKPVEASFWRGYLALQRDREDLALSDFERAIQDSNWRAPALGGRSRVELRRGEFEKALATSVEQLRHSAKEQAPIAHFGRCVALFHLNRIDEALAACEEARVGGTDADDSLYGVLLLAAGKREQGLAHLRARASASQHVYAAIWAALLAGQREPLVKVVADGWPAELKRYVLGEQDAAALEAAAKALPGGDAGGRRCEALTFEAVMAENAGDTEEAWALYEEALETRRNEYVEAVYARFRLRELSTPR